MSGATSRRRSPLSATAHALGNVFLGIALGLVGYSLCTDALTYTTQRQLDAQLPAIEVAERAAPGFDWEGWESEDKAYWDGLSAGKPFGRLVARGMRLDAVVVKGVGRSDLMKGPGWIPYTDLPGRTGNCGISGHRTTYGAPFRQIDRLKRGSEVTFISPFRVYRYRVVRVFTVTPNRVDVVRSTSEPMLTLTACHPPYSARLRIIAQCRLVSVTKIDR